MDTGTGTPPTRLRASARRLPGSLRHEVVIDGGRHVLFTDEPAHLGGDDSGPAPHELFPAALASCVSTTLVMYARSRGTRESGDPRRCRLQPPLDAEAVHVAVRLDPSMPPELERMIKVESGCPVRRAIESGIDSTSTSSRTRPASPPTDRRAVPAVLTRSSGAGHHVRTSRHGPRISRDAFTARLDLLEDSGQVSAAARQQTLDFIDAVEAAFAVGLDEENGAMLVTHLAMALTRTERRAPLLGDPPP